MYEFNSFRKPPHRRVGLVQHWTVLLEVCNANQPIVWPTCRTESETLSSGARSVAYLRLVITDSFSVVLLIAAGAERRSMNQSSRVLMGRPEHCVVGLEMLLRFRVTALSYVKATQGAISC